MENNLDLEKFDPTTAELTAMVEKTGKLTVTDFSDKATLALVHDSRIELKNKRIEIEKKGKAFREDAVKFQKAVIAKEKELIAIIEPEELRLGEIEEQAKNAAIVEERKRKLPERIERLKAVNPNIVIDEPAILGMDDVTFETNFNREVAAQNEIASAKIKAEQDEKEAALKAEREKLDAEKRAHDEMVAKELAEKTAREEAELKAKLEAEEKERKEKEAVEKAEREKLEEKTRLERAEKYQKWLDESGWTKETQGEYMIDLEDDGWTLWKRVSKLKSADVE